MKILTFTETAFALGAHSRHKEMVKALLRAGHEVVWIGPSKADVSELVGVRFVHLRWPWLSRLSILGYVFRLGLNLVHSNWQYDSFDATFVIRERELLVLWLLRRRRKGASLLFFQRAAAVEKLQFSLQHERSIPRRIKLRLQIAFWGFLRPVLYRVPDKIVVQTPRHGRELASHGAGISNALIVLPNSVGASWMRSDNLDVRLLADVPLAAKVIGYVGNIYLHGKGLDLMLRAFRAITDQVDCVLVIFGEGPDLEKIRNLTEELGLGRRVRILGRIDGAIRYMRSLDALMHLSRIDDCPNVVLEALQSGVPLIASRVPAHEFLLGETFLGLADAEETAIAQIAVLVLKHDEYRRELLIQQVERARLFGFDWGGEVVRIFEDRWDKQHSEESAPDGRGKMWGAQPLSLLHPSGSRN